MQHGTTKPTGPWRLTFSLRQEPRCPGCAEFLQPIVVEIRSGWAWCPLCAGHALHAVPHLAFILEHASMAAHSTIQHGVRFYTPRAFTAKPMNALDFYEEVASANRYELTAAGARSLDHAATSVVENTGVEMRPSSNTTTQRVKIR